MPGRPTGRAATARDRRHPQLLGERTRVELEHRHLERHGEDWQCVRDGVASERDWPLYLQRYADLAGD